MNSQHFNIYLTKPSDITVVKALCQYTGSKFIYYGKNIYERYYMKVEVTQKANLYIFKNYSFRCVEEEYDTDIHPDESIAKDIFEEKMLSQLQKEANFAIIHECKIRNTSLPEAIKIVIDYKKLQISPMKGEIPNFFKKRFESEVDYYIHRFGILCYEYLGAVLWRILDVLADECVDEEYDDLAILEFISVINAIKNAEKK